MASKDQNKEPWFAVNLSSIIGGLGQLYAGRKTKGWSIFTIQLILTGLTMWMIFYFSISIKYIIFSCLTIIIITIWNLFDAYKSVNRNNSNEFEEERRKGKDLWLAIFLSHIPGIGHMYLKKWGWGILFFVLAMVVNNFDNCIISVLYAIFVMYHIYKIPNGRKKINKKHISVFIILYFVVQLIPILIVTNYTQSYVMTGSSMEPTLKAHDRILVKKVNKKIERGDIIVFNLPKGFSYKGMFVKRVIGLGGDIIITKNNSLYINGSKIDNNEYNINLEDARFKNEVYRIPEDKLFVLGDNINNSLDSRIFGCLSREEIIGTVFRLYYPFRREKLFRDN